MALWFYMILIYHILFSQVLVCKWLFSMTIQSCNLIVLFGITNDWQHCWGSNGGNTCRTLCKGIKTTLQLWKCSYKYFRKVNISKVRKASGIKLCIKWSFRKEQFSTPFYKWDKHTVNFLRPFWLYIFFRVEPPLTFKMSKFSNLSTKTVSQTAFCIWKQQKHQWIITMGLENNFHIGLKQPKVDHAFIFLSRL